MATAEIPFDPTSMHPLDDGGVYPQHATDDVGTVTLAVVDFADTGTEIIDLASFTVPTDIDTSGTVTFRLKHYAATAAASKNTEYRYSHRAVNNSEAYDGAYTNEDSGDLAMDATQDDETEHTWTETASNLGWAANDTIIHQLARIAASVNELSGDDRVVCFTIEIPLT